MVDKKYTQRQLAREWNRRSKEQKLKQLKEISIWKLKDGSYTDVDPSNEKFPDIRFFILMGILFGLAWAVYYG
jgi:hypothetical protein